MPRDDFSCPRTCPLVNARWCRFRPVLDVLGRVRVDSHTARIVVDHQSAELLRAAVISMGGQWLGAGSHRLFDGSYVGQGFRLPGWSYPLVLQEGGKLAYDDFGGAWGNPADLEKLKGAYALAAAEKAAKAQGWLCEKSGACLTIHHPSGGTLTIGPGGSVDATQFVGSGCHDAILALGLPVSDLQAKPEFGAVQAVVQVGI